MEGDTLTLTHYLPYTYPYTYAHIHTHACTYACTHPSTHTQSGETALHIAVREERDDIVELLLEANADPDMPVKARTPHTVVMVT